MPDADAAAPPADAAGAAAADAAGAAKATSAGGGTAAAAKEEVLEGEWRHDRPWTMAGAGAWPSSLWTYSGDWEGGRRHGHGEVVLANGARYEGEWRNDAWHGEGVLSFPAAAAAAAAAAAGSAGGGGGGSGSEPQASGADGALQVVVRMSGRIMGSWAETQVEEA